LKESDSTRGGGEDIVVDTGFEVRPNRDLNELDSTSGGGGEDIVDSSFKVGPSAFTSLLANIIVEVFE
jgi:hypothetical protein